MTLLTEEEAGTKWCPFVQVHEEGGVGKGARMFAINRPHVMQQMTCVGSACMAWRWRDTVPDIDDGKFAPNAHFPDYEDDEFKALAQSGAEPARPPEVPADWVWFPCEIDEVSGDYEGGYWEEPEDVREQRHAKAVAACRGFCGEFGVPT